MFLPPPSLSCVSLCFLSGSRRDPLTEFLRSLPSCFFFLVLFLVLFCPPAAFYNDTLRVDYLTLTCSYGLACVAARFLWASCNKLNMYNFRKVVQDPNSGEFKHDLFRKVCLVLCSIFPSLPRFLILPCRVLSRPVLSCPRASLPFLSLAVNFSVFSSCI